MQSQQQKTSFLSRLRKEKLQNAKESTSTIAKGKLILQVIYTSNFNLHSVFSTYFRRNLGMPWEKLESLLDGEAFPL